MVHCDNKKKTIFQQTRKNSKIEISKCRMMQTNLFENVLMFFFFLGKYVMNTNRDCRNFINTIIIISIYLPDFQLVLISHIILPLWLTERFKNYLIYFVFFFFFRFIVKVKSNGKNHHNCLLRPHYFSFGFFFFRCCC